MFFTEDNDIFSRFQNDTPPRQSYQFQKCSLEIENQNPIHSMLEFTDPTPSIHDLFVKFNAKFFWGKLGMVSVLWSNRMTTCAGICSFERRGGFCKISLSAPLLSLRPRKDLVETLLHEMIHAFLFVTNNYRDRDDHGPEFHKHMYRINKEAGTNITVYHTFHDEVSYYQKHIWRCNGPCQYKKPFFGLVRRAMNRAPGPNDSWWNQHKAECNGTFIKIAEPEKPAKNSKKIKSANQSDGKKMKDIRAFFNKGNSSSVLTSNGQKKSNVMTLSDIVDRKPTTGLKSNTSTLVVTKTNKNEGKVLGKKNNSGSTKRKNPNVTNKNKNPKTEGSSKVTTDKTSLLKNSSSKNKSECPNSQDIREVVRNKWANKYPQKSEPEIEQSPKKLKINCPICDEGFSENVIESHVEDCLSNLSSSQSEMTCSDEEKDCPVCSKKIFQSELQEHLENCLNCSFENDDDDEKFEEESGKESKEVEEVTCQSVPCPCCYKWFEESEMNSHLDECLTLRVLKDEILES